MYIDPALIEFSKTHPEQTVEVILIIDNYHNTIQQSLINTKFQVTNSDHANAGLLYGKIQISRIELLETITDVRAIILDQAQFTF